VTRNRTSKLYFVVLSKAGPKRDQSPEEAERIQQEQIRHNLMLLLAHGPVTDDDVLRGISIYAASDREVVEQLARQDLAVVAGRLVRDSQLVRIPGGLPTVVPKRLVISKTQAAHRHTANNFAASQIKRQSLHYHV